MATVSISRQSPWEIQKSVVFSVFQREVGTRFGRFRLGYLWAVLEPTAMVLILSAVRVLFGRSDVAGLSFPVFFAAGVISFLLFSHIINTSLAAVESNLGLFNYQRVKPADIFAARSFLELLIALSTGTLVLVGLYWAGYTFVWNDTLETIAVIACLFIMSSGLGLICCVLGPLWQESKKIIPILVRPLFFVSGMFFPANALPHGIREIALINPLLHVTELLRGAMFQGYTSHEGSLFYLFLWTVGSLAAGLTVYRLYRVSLLTSGSIR